MFHRIVVGFDGSQGSRHALATALQLAAEQQAEIWALGVEERLPRYAATVGEMDEARELANHFFAGLMDEARKQAVAAGVELKTEVVRGHAAQTIVGFAKGKRADLIIVGHSGQSGVWGNFIGTTSDKVIRHADCAVLIVR